MQETSPGLVLPVDPHRDHTLGERSASATLLEYGDYQCPFCRQAHFIVGDLLARAGDQFRYVFRHFPLTQVHPYAQRAAEAAEAAGAQGRFWEMHDTLYQNQEALDDASLVAYADALGLDVGRFISDLRGGAHRARVREDFMSGVRSGVNGTPTFYINGRRHNGPWDPESLLGATLGSHAPHAGATAARSPW